jgi:hypothetical protein
MLEVLSEEAGNCVDYRVYSLADLQTAFSAIDSIVRVPSYLDFYSLVSFFTIIGINTSTVTSV